MNSNSRPLALGSVTSGSLRENHQPRLFTGVTSWPAGPAGRVFDLEFWCPAWGCRPARVGWAPVPRPAGRVLSGGRDWMVWLWRGQGLDAGERAGDVVCPGPGRRDSQVPSALAFDDPPGGMEHLVAQRLRLGSGKVAVEGEEPDPGQQVTRDGRGLAPGGVDRVVPGGHMPQSGALAAADPVLDPGLGAVAGFEELDLPAGGAGGGDLVPLALVLLEQGQLRAGVRVLPPDQDPHAGRPGGEAVPAGAVPQQPGQLGDLRVRPSHVLHQTNAPAWSSSQLCSWTTGSGRAQLCSLRDVSPSMASRREPAVLG